MASPTSCRISTVCSPPPTSLSQIPIKSGPSLHIRSSVKWPRQPAIAIDFIDPSKYTGTLAFAPVNSGSQSWIFTFTGYCAAAGAGGYFGTPDLESVFVVHDFGAMRFGFGDKAT
jgi:hypothetical protein